MRRIFWTASVICWLILLTVGPVEAQQPEPREGPAAADGDRPPPPPRAEGPGRKREHRRPQRDHGRQYSLEQATSDQAQLHTIAFDGLAFLTGDFGSDTFLPPGKVSDYFGFQYMRDIDASVGGHNTDFLTRISNNMLYILTPDQRSQLVANPALQGGGGERVVDEMGEPASLDQLDLLGLDAGDSRLRFEVVEHRGVGHPRAGADRVEAGAAEAGVGVQLERRFEDRRLGLLAPSGGLSVHGCSSKGLTATDRVVR